jgi:ferredoxin-NADP reductase
MARAAVLGRLSWRVAQLAGVRDETATARTLVLEVPDWPGHLPGQHVDVRLTAADGYSTERSYSIASAPDGSRLELTIARLDDGEVSPYLTQVLSPGDPLELRGPIGGYFAWRPADPAPVVLIGGGSGVVPLMAMVRTRIAGLSPAPMRLIYSTRSRGTLLYAAELERIADQHPGLSVNVVYTRAAPPGWHGRAGRLDAMSLAALAGPQDAGAWSFVCGPTSFVENIANLLIDQGLDSRQVKTERFGPSGSGQAEAHDER